jgi:hypothetical protein
MIVTNTIIRQWELLVEGGSILFINNEYDGHHHTATATFNRKVCLFYIYSYLFNNMSRGGHHHPTTATGTNNDPTSLETGILFIYLHHDLLTGFLAGMKCFFA